MENNFNEDAMTGANENYVNKFSKKDFEKTIKELKNLKPFVIEIQLFQKAFDLLLKDLNNGEIKNVNLCYMLSSIKVIILNEDLELKENEARFIYNNGDMEIINIIKKRSE